MSCDTPDQIMETTTSKSSRRESAMSNHDLELNVSDELL
jgi:hypothetical protein